MKPLRWFIEWRFDVGWPPKGGEPDAPFRRNAVAFAVRILIIHFAALVSW